MIIILRRKHSVHRIFSIVKVELLFCSPGDTLVRYDIILFNRSLGKSHSPSLCPRRPPPEDNNYKLQGECMAK